MATPAQAEVLADTRDMSRDEWLSWRRKGVGSSDAAAVAGLNPYRTPLEVYLDKLGLLEEQDETEAMYWGTVLEDVVAREFAARTGLKVWRRNAILQHPEYAWVLANIDRYIVQKGNWGVLECKTTSTFMRSDWSNGEVPPMYYVQLQHQLAVTGLEYGYIAVLIGGREFAYFEIERDEETIKYLMQVEHDFWHHNVIPQNPPPMDGSSASSELLNRLYPEAEPDSVMYLPSDAMALIAQYDAAAEDEKEAKARKDEAANRLKELLGDAERGIAGEREVRWPTVESRRLDTKRLKSERPDIYEEYTRISTYRRFSVR